MNFQTIIDVNLNRASEGLRVLDELARHELRDADLFNSIKKIRHSLQSIKKDYPNIEQFRESDTDPGRVHNPSERKSLSDIIEANFGRVQESFRVLEEVTDLKEVCSKSRYLAYDLEKVFLEIINSKKNRLNNMGVYIVGDDVDTLVNCAKKGAGIIQLRDKKSSAKEIFNKAKQIKAQLDVFENNSIFIVNDRPDIAVAVGADGVHVGQDDLPISEVRKVVGDNMIIGKSTHAIEQALEAKEEGADYIGVGPLWETPTKAGKSSVGLKYLKQVVDAVDLPFVAIGGIDLSNVDEVLKAGAKSFAVVRAANKIEDFVRKVDQCK